MLIHRKDAIHNNNDPKNKVTAPLMEADEHDGYFVLIHGEVIMVRDPMLRARHAAMYVPSEADLDDASSICTRKMNPERDVSISQLERNTCLRGLVLSSAIDSTLFILLRPMWVLCLILCAEIELWCKNML